MNPNEDEPRLAPPGAGLPAVERAIARLLFAWRRWTGNPNTFEARFRAERERIRSLIRDLDPAAGAKRVLIRRVPGLEDSSRYWSVWMTLDHLRIVHREMARIIAALARETVPDGEARTAAVKPGEAAEASVVAEYESSCEEALGVAASAGNLYTRARFTHPWFGPMNAAAWFALAGGHLKIHRVQIERIVAGLAARELP